MKKELKEASKAFRRKFENGFVPEISERDKIEVAFCAGAEYKKSVINEAVEYFNEQVGHFSDSQKVMKLREEINELDGSVELGTPTDVIEECSDVATIAYHIAVRNGFKGTPDELFLIAYDKMKRRVESGERDYKNRDF